MKKLKAISIMMLTTCIVNINSIYAANATLNVDKTEVKEGDTITVNLNATCEQGLSYIATDIKYDTEVLDLQDKKIANDWMNYGTSKFELFSNSSQKFTTLQAITLSFKVKENIQSETTTISTSGIEITDIKNNEYNVGKQEKTINIVKEPIEKVLSSIKISKQPNKTEYTVGEKFDKEGMVVTAVYSDGSESNITSYIYSPSENLSEKDTEILISYTEDEITKSIKQKIQIIAISDADKEETNKQEENKQNNIDNNGKENISKEENNKKNEIPIKELPHAGKTSYYIAIAILTILCFIGYFEMKKN